jgi:anti-sigma B factor antagonist
MGVFMGIARQVKEKGGNVKMVGINDRVNRVFTLIGITKIFSIYNTVEDALDSF